MREGFVIFATITGGMLIGLTDGIAGGAFGFVIVGLIFACIPLAEKAR